MAIDHRIGTKVQKNLRREDAAATRVEPYPYIGVVKNNLDPTRAGRLQVYIPDLGGDPDNQKNWRTVSYASPFMGYTSNKFEQSDVPSKADTYNTVAHTYGMWMVPPDLGVEVIVLFVAGDPQRGYWLACVNSNLSHYMVPGLAGSRNVDLNQSSDSTKKSFIGGNPMPVVEFNEYNPTNINQEFYRNAKPVHEAQFNILKQQGLDRDPVRGAISSSSQRESPSYVFGISTPGRPTNDPAEDVNAYLAKARTGQLTEEYYKVKSRKGGHTLVMDDGSVLGEDRLFRLRSSRGHQILMHDTMNSFYIAHADGTSWIEMTSDGQIKAYTKGGFSLRSEGSINLHTDGNMNIDVKNKLNIKVGSTIQVESAKTNLLTGALSVTSQGTVEFKAGGPFNVESAAGMSFNAGADIIQNAPHVTHNSDPAAVVNEVKPLKTYSQPDTVFDSGIGVWINTTKALETIVTVAPCHEPYYRGEVQLNIPEESDNIKLKETYNGTIDAIKNVSGSNIKEPAGDKELRDQVLPLNSVGTLSKDQTQAYLAQMGKSESGVGTTKGVGNGKSGYECQNEIGFIGKYQFGYEALIDAGYIKSNVTSLAQMDNPNSWTGKDGITSKDAWFNNPSVQEKVMLEYTQRNYDRMITNGAITADMPPDEVGGMLAVAHLLGPNKGTPQRPGALGWRQGLGGADQLGTSGDSYFQKGKYAVKVLAPKVPNINAG